MTPATCFAGKPVALFGLGGSGLVTAEALAAGGAEVVCCDDDPAAQDRARAKGLKVENLAAGDWSRFAALVLSPGVPLTHPEPHWAPARAKEAGIEIIGDIELFCRERARLAPRAPFIAITGTNGKSTTTALAAHILRSAGMEVALGGNIGTAILALDPPSDRRVHVIEVSSFQIDLAPSLAPTLGALINLTPDHLDRHGTMENYAAVKERLLARAGQALIGVDDEHGRAVWARRSGRAPGRCFPVTTAAAAGRGFAVADGAIAAIGFGTSAEPIMLGKLGGIPTLRGRHNAQNATFAAAACWLMGVAPDVIAEALCSFRGLPHRMEEVGRRGRVIFVNDSKATNADAAEKALLCFDRIFWIAGGKAKEGGIAPLKPLFNRIDKAYLIGAASGEFAQTLDGHVPYESCGTLDVAVRRAAADAGDSSAPEPVVLLSPACASYDQFGNFGARGDRFRELVRALPGVVATRGADEAG